MALKPLRPCRHPGCAALVRGGYCPQHQPKERRSAQAAEWHRWYNLPLWTRELRPAQLLREPFCRECAKAYPPGDPRHRTPATVVDHVRPHRGDWGRFVDPRNHQSLCKRHHDQKTAQETWGQRRDRARN